MCTGEGSKDKIIRGKISGELRCLCWGLFSANSIILTEGNKGTESRHQEKKSHCQEIFHKYLFCMSIYDHINVLDYTIEFRYNREKQDKSLSNHHLPLHITQQN